MIWPAEPDNSNAVASWCKKLLRACRASELKPGVGYKVRRTDMGTVLEIEKLSQPKIYIRVCKRDGTEQYMPVYVSGPAVDEADIPAGADIYDPSP